jgi:hypothetical protein
MASRRDPKTLPSGRSPHVDRGGAANDVVKTPDRLALDDAFVNHESLRRGLTENLNARRIENAKVSDRVEKAFSKVSLSKPAENDRSPLNHVAPDASTFEAVSAVVSRRVEAIRRSDVAPVISVRERSKLVKWDKTRKSDGKAADAATGSLELEALLKFVSVGQSGPLFASVPAEAARYQAEEQAQEVLDKAVSNGKGKPQLKQDAAEAAGVLSADTLVAEKVNVQMKSVTAPEHQLTYGLIPNGAAGNETQKTLLQTFELRPGASDVTAYHDFHTLRIAFEHVWTRLFDGDLEKLGRELYKEYVGLKDFLGYDPNTDRPITSLDDLKWLINEIRTLSDFTQEAIPPQLTNGQGGSDGAGTGPAKGASDVTTDVARVAGAVLTGGLSALAEWAINEISNIDKMPIKHWDDLNGQKLEGRDRITATFTYGAVAAGVIELALQSDLLSHWKGFWFQRWDQASGQFQNFAAVDNSKKDVKAVNGQSYFVASTSVPASMVPTGAITFKAEASPGNNTGRYVLSHLAEGDKLRGGMRITFYWQDN